MVGDPWIAQQLKQAPLFPGLRSRLDADELLREADQLLRDGRA